MGTLNAVVIGYEGKILKDDGDIVDKVIIEIPDQDKNYNFMPDETRVTITHDYVRFHGNIGIEQRNNKGEYPVKSVTGASNWVHTDGSIDISIRNMIEIILPLLKDHKYLKPEHLVNKDGENVYCYEAGIIHYHKDGKRMVSFRRVGDSHWGHVSLSLFNDIKDTLKLSLSREEIKTKNAETI